MISIIDFIKKIFVNDYVINDIWIKGEVSNCKMHSSGHIYFTLKDNNGAMVAIDPRNGAVIAMVSMPAYDPNLFVHGISSKNYRALSDSPERTLFNRALRGQYPPGSTIKPFIGLAGLELKELQSHDEINCPGWYMLKNDERRYRDWKKHGHKKTDLLKAITESCDVFFYDLALTLGIDNMSSYLAHFGIGKKTGVDLLGDLSGLNPSREWKRRNRNLPWFPGETLIIGIGQGFMLTTPFQLATATSAISMMGQRYKPQMIYAIQNEQNSPLIKSKVERLKSVPISEEKNWSKNKGINIMQKQMTPEQEKQMTVLSLTLYMVKNLQEIGRILSF